MNKRNTEMKNAAVSDDLTLEIPNETHRQEYQRIMERWEQLEDNIQPELMRRGNTPYEKWLEYCEDEQGCQPIRRRLSLQKNRRFFEGSLIDIAFYPY